MKTMRKMNSILIALLTVLLTVGCGHTGTELAERAAAVAIAAGVHSNSAVIPFNSAGTRNLIFNGCYTGCNFTFVAVDGDPQPYFQTRVEQPSIDGLSNERMTTIANEYTDQLINILASATPKTEEVDTLKAIRVASQSLRCEDSSTTDRVLLILDSGLSTTGYMNFAKDLSGNKDETSGLLLAAPEDVVETLRGADAIPDLTDIEVVWSFCGEVAYPQKPLSARDKKHLQEIWTAVLLAGGAKSVTFSNDILANEPYSGLPAVSCIEVENESVRIESTRSNDEPVVTTSAPMETFVLDETDVKFVGDKDIFVDEKKARAKLREVADDLMRYPDNRVYVVGTTATGIDEKDFCMQLSEARAEAVISVLEEMGVDRNRLIPKGLGYEDHWHECDIDENGNWNEAIASKNRKVLIIDLNHEDAKYVN